MSAKTFEERVYNNYHTALKVAKNRLVSLLPEPEEFVCYDECCKGYFAMETVPFHEIRQEALKLTALRYKVPVSEVARIAHELRREDDKAKPKFQAPESKKRIHKRK